MVRTGPTKQNRRTATKKRPGPLPSKAHTKQAQGARKRGTSSRRSIQQAEPPVSAFDGLVDAPDTDKSDKLERARALDAKIGARHVESAIEGEELINQSC
ncbi:hypothetical protein MMC07_008903 [Pseudocyphellaria aurata]|nr:hypothetical protein [Pseudocyphellaria aurata]